jgi:hypothetical protein
MSKVAREENPEKLDAWVRSWRKQRKPVNITIIKKNIKCLFLVLITIFVMKSIRILQQDKLT